MQWFPDFVGAAELTWPAAVVAGSPGGVPAEFRTYCNQWPTAGPPP
jgi:hypothetical protein